MSTSPKQNFRKSSAFVAAGIALTVGLSGCSASSSDAGNDSSTPVSGGTFNVARTNIFEGFNLDTESLNATFQISAAVLEPLIRTNAEGTGLAPGIATKWTYNADATQLTIDLVTGAKFSDGSALTAEDVAFSIDQWKSGLNYGASYAVIDTTTIVDEDTIVLNLTGPNSTLPSILSYANSGVIPEDFAGMTADEFWQTPIGAGAFTVESWSSTGDVVLKKNPNYYVAGQPYLDEVVSTFGSDANSVALQLKAKTLDAVDAINAVTASTLDSAIVNKQLPHITPALIFNTLDPALSDPEVRAAIAYAINYGDIVKSAYKGYGDVPNGALPTSGMNWAPPTVGYFTNDNKKAVAALAAVASAPKKLTLSYANNPSESLAAQIIEKNLSDIGIEVTLDAQDAGTQYANLTSGEYQMTLFPYNAISTEVADPISYLAATQALFSGFNTDFMWEQLAVYEIATSEDEKKVIVGSVQDELFTEAPFVALAQISNIEAQQTYMHGMNVSPWGSYYLDTVWKATK